MEDVCRMLEDHLPVVHLSFPGALRGQSTHAHLTREKRSRRVVASPVADEETEAQGAEVARLRGCVSTWSTSRYKVPVWPVLEEFGLQMGSAPDCCLALGKCFPSLTVLFGQLGTMTVSSPVR